MIIWFNSECVLADEYIVNQLYIYLSSIADINVNIEIRAVFAGAVIAVGTRARLLTDRQVDGFQFRK